MTEYCNEHKENTVNFVWIFVKGELVSSKDDYKEFLTRINVKARSLFIRRNGEIVNGKEMKHDFN
jgi:hypothetical protein